MNTLNKMIDFNLSTETLQNYYTKIDENYCCVCFTEKQYICDRITNEILSLSDVECKFFADNTIPNELLVKSSCNIHYICIYCIRKLVNNYENHPINDSNSHLSCPYPFDDCVTSIGFKNIFDHNLIKKVCNEQEWLNYISHAENYSFPGWTIIKCPILYYKMGERVLCNTDILLENEIIKNNGIGDLIIDCTQNPDCLKRFCFNCKQTLSYYQTDCYDCKTTYENENPYVFNYYFNKMKNIVDNINLDNTIINYDEDSYLYKNNEITESIAVEEIINVIENTNLYFICPICKISLYKTERCNGLSHHNIERCYACGRIGFKTRGLGEHWNTNGLGGCFRFDHDAYVKNQVPSYKCNDSYCSNHDRGDCIEEDHQEGIKDLCNTRKKGYIYHMLKSLLPDIRLKVYDTLYNKLIDSKDSDYLPYKQTLCLLSKLKSHIKDYSENVFYESINCIHPCNIPEFTTKNTIIDTDDYLTSYGIKIKLSDSYTNNSQFNYYLNTSSDNEDTVSNDSTTHLLSNTSPIRLQTSRILEEIILELNNQNNQNTTPSSTNPIITEFLPQMESDITDLLPQIQSSDQFLNITPSSESVINSDITYHLSNITSENIVQDQEILRYNGYSLINKNIDSDDE